VAIPAHEGNEVPFEAEMPLYRCEIAVVMQKRVVKGADDDFLFL
jgi:hypothetical protein